MEKEKGIEMENEEFGDCDNYNDDRDYVRADLRDLLLSAGFRQSYVEEIIIKLEDNPSVLELCSLFESLNYEGLSFEQFLKNGMFTEEAVTHFLLVQDDPKDFLQWLKNYVHCVVMDFESDGIDLEETMWGTNQGLKSKFKKELSASDFNLLKAGKKKLHFSWCDVGRLLLAEKPEKYIEIMNDDASYPDWVTNKLP